MSAITETDATAMGAAINWRRWGLLAAQIALAVVFIAIWKFGADYAGESYVADPFLVWDRILEMAANGELWQHTYVTLRLSAIGFALGCIGGVALPFILRRLPRLSAAVEPYILASVGVPKYALIPLFILWFGINDAPKLWLVGLLVFYPVFIAIFAGIRSVDGRLINMARIFGASENAISRTIIWRSLQPFFFSALKISLPRAISAAIIGEFLVGNEGIGFYIENSRQSVDTVGVFAGVAIATALVLIINAILVAIDNRVNAWRPKDRDMTI
ncbi:MAG: ABC transporter permease [Hyphomicrobiales bacterium]|nr:ABC transporter permease [Hyphomicrobiales bacterium]